LASLAALRRRSKLPPDWNTGGYAMSTLSGLSFTLILGGSLMAASVSTGACVCVCVRACACVCMCVCVCVWQWRVFGALCARA
jgi:hypothetical protein